MEEFLPAGALVSWLLVAVAVNTIGIILRPFITRNVPLHFVQWIVYGSALVVLTLGLGCITVREIDLFLRALGQFLVIASVTGLSLSIAALWVLAHHRARQV